MHLTGALLATLLLIGFFVTVATNFAFNDNEDSDVTELDDALSMETMKWLAENAEEPRDEYEEDHEHFDNEFDDDEDDEDSAEYRHGPAFLANV
ncbi:hypothetical protein L596_027157 [Steinernema carpocapsae]|uniref:Uncharacterized protein n=1 Tax=Steinernema carpocapsae TaxID=34508 RepID=A0A4U5M4G1_STECR|nr:hypothetical protein L596_027157 [Steinernema carpocapsae]